LENPSKIYPNPLQKQQKPTPKGQRAQSVDGLCLWMLKNGGEKKMVESWVCERIGKKWTI
jgi:hypothetical protein